MKIFSTMILALIATVAIVSTVHAYDTASFTENLKNCSEYFGSQTIDLDAIKLTTTKQIQGFKNNKCVYKETISTKDAQYSVMCQLSRKQISELVSVMEDFEKDSSNSSLNLNDFDAVQNTTVVNAWAKYLQDPEVCSIETK